jgi:hypothetical protein
MSCKLVIFNENDYSDFVLEFYFFHEKLNFNHFKLDLRCFSSLNLVKNFEIKKCFKNERIIHTFIDP